MIPHRFQSLDADLKSSDDSARSRAFSELAQSEHEEALAILWRACNQDELKVEAEVSFKTSVLEHPRTALRHPDKTIRSQSLRLSGEHKNKSAIDEVSRVIRNDSAVELREQAAQTLGEIGDEAGVAGLKHGSIDQALRVREAVLRALTKITHPSSEKVVVDFLIDADWGLRQRARDHLENSGWMPGNRRENTSWAIVQGRFDEAVKNGTEAVEPLLNAAVYVSDVEVRHWASVALARLSSPEVVDRLHAISETGNSNARQAALECLKMMGQPVRNEPFRQRTAPKASPIKKTPPPRLSVIDAAIRMLAVIGEP